MFIAFTILFIVGNASLAFLLFISTQKGQWLDLIFNWQSMLRKFDLSGTRKGMMLHKFLGGCDLCFCHLISFFGFWAYVVFIIGNDAGFRHWWMWIIWYLIYVPSSTNLGLYFTSKVYGKG